MNKSGASVLTLVHDNGRPGMALAINPDRSMALVMMDGNGKLRGAVSLENDNQIYVQRYDLESNVVRRWPDDRAPQN